jgi:hypothetical protein
MQKFASFTKVRQKVFAELKAFAGLEGFRRTGGLSPDWRGFAGLKVFTGGRAAL